MRRREFLRQVGLAGAAALASSAALGQAKERPEQRRPNVLFIITDQQPTSCVAAYGNQVLRTPNLDRLAREGALLERFYISAFPCSPSRACMYTGRYAHRHGVIVNDIPLSPQIPSIGQIFRAAGYTTAFVGKWHLGGHMYRDYRLPAEKIAKGDGGNWQYKLEWTEDGFKLKRVPGGYGEDRPQLGFQYWVGGWRHYHQWLYEEGLGRLLDKHLFGNHSILPSAPEGQHMYSKVDEDHHMSAFLALHAERFIRGQARSTRPWLCVLSFYGPHLPVAPPKPWDEMYSLDQVALPPNHRDDLKGKPIRQMAMRRNYRSDRWTEEQFKDYVRRYWGYCSYIDHQIGRVFKALDETGQWDNTIVVFTSDHGDMVAAHGMIWKLCWCAYEELFRVPCLIRIPGTTPAGLRVRALASNIDLLPTLLEATGIRAPEGMDGRSLVPVLSGRSQRHRDVVFAHICGASHMCRDERYKFALHWRVRDRDELYDLQEDPGELRNLALEPEYQGLVKKMRQRIVQWLERTEHPLRAYIAAQAAKEPEIVVLNLRPEISHFNYLGGNEFEIAVTWHVNSPIKAEGRYWCFCQFCNPKYGTDGDIAFRFTKYPDVPIQQWQPGKTYTVGPVRVKIPDTAGSGNYTVRVGLWEPNKRRGPGILKGTAHHFMEIGTLTVVRKDGKVVDVKFKPERK